MRRKKLVALYLIDLKIRRHEDLVALVRYALCECGVSEGSLLNFADGRGGLAIPLAVAQLEGGIIEVLLSETLFVAGGHYWRGHWRSGSLEDWQASSYEMRLVESDLSALNRVGRMALADGAPIVTLDRNFLRLLGSSTG